MLPQEVMNGMDNGKSLTGWPPHAALWFKALLSEHCQDYTTFTGRPPNSLEVDLWLHTWDQNTPQSDHFMNETLLEAYEAILVHK